MTLKKENRPATSKKIRNVDDVERAIAHYCKVLQYEHVTTTAQHLSTEIDYGQYGFGDVEAIARGIFYYTPIQLLSFEEC